MIYPRIECPCCGTKFTSDDAGRRTCGECRVWEHDPTEPEDSPVDFGESAHDVARSLENYRRVSGAKPRR